LYLEVRCKVKPQIGGTMKLQPAETAHKRASAVAKVFGNILVGQLRVGCSRSRDLNRLKPTPRLIHSTERTRQELNPLLTDS
jgi:hypothetical protein